MIVQETVTSFTASQLLDNERQESLRTALVNVSTTMTVGWSHSCSRTHSAPGFRTLINDELLRQQRLATEIGRVKNINKTQSRKGL